MVWNVGCKSGRGIMKNHIRCLTGRRSRGPSNAYVCKSEAKEPLCEATYNPLFWLASSWMEKLKRHD